VDYAKENTVNIVVPALAAVTVKVTFVNEDGKVESGLPFDDWSYEAVEYAYENELMNGVADDEFAIREYEDYDSISDYAVSAMGWAVNAGLMKGVTDTTLQPQGTTTRAQVATMLMRFIENIDE
jgi:hypothetical protein